MSVMWGSAGTGAKCSIAYRSWRVYDVLNFLGFEVFNCVE